MMTTRTWRVAAAGLATAALMTTSLGAASAQVPGVGDLPTDPTELADALEGLDADELAAVLEELGLPADTPLDDLLDALSGGLPDGADGDGDDDADGGVDPGEATGTDAGPIPTTGMGGFTGYANAAGTTVFVGLPPELHDGLADVLEAIGIAGSFDADGRTLDGIRIDLARAQADLERAAAGEDIASEASAFVTNLLLASPEAGEPGACTGGPAEVDLPPDAETPLLTVTIVGVDCAESDERAFADVQIAGLDIRLAALLELGLPPEVADGVRDGIAQLNDALLTPASDGLCQLIDPALDGLLPGADPCAEDTPLLQLRDPFDLDVPVVDLDLVAATTEVTQDGGSVTATATSTFAGLDVLGVACLGGIDGDEPLAFTSTATSDGTTASRDASAPPLALALCQQEQDVLRLLLGDGPLGDIEVFERVIQDDLVDGQLEALFDGVDTLLEALTTEALTQGTANLGPVEGSGTSAGTDPFVAAQTLPLAGLPGLGDVVGDVAVIVVGGETEVGVNALPAGAPEAPPTEGEPPAPATEPAASGPLPRTGTGAGVLVGLAALGAAAALRRRDG
jgi:hypothetical protein